MNCILVLIAALAVAQATPIDRSPIQEKLQLLNPTIVMLEQILNVEDENQCIEKMFCLIEKDMPNDFNNPLKYYSRFLTNALQEISPTDFDQVKALLAEYPHTSQLVNAILLGKNDLQGNACDMKFDTCLYEETKIIASVKMLENQRFMNETRVKRSDEECIGFGVTCGVVGAGCAICGLFTAGFCVPFCAVPIPGLCVTAGLTCTV